MKKHPGKTNQLWRCADPPAQITALYLVAALLWILLSDRIVVEIVNAAPSLGFLHPLKGVGFVIVTGGLLYLLCRNRFRGLIAVRLRLREQRRAYRTLLGNLPGMVYRCRNDRDWTMQFVSGGAEQLTGYSPEQLMRGDVAYGQLVHADDRDSVWEAIQSAIERRSRFLLKYRIHDAHGEERWVWEQGRPVFDSEDRMVSIEGFVIDITDRVRLESTERERDALAATAQAMDQSMGVIGHELRTPLAAMRAISEVLQDDVDADSDEGRKLIGHLHDEVLRLTEMANHMIERARIQSPTATWSWERVSMRRILDEVIHVMTPLVDTRRVKLRARLDQPDLTMRGDSDAIRRLVLNLVSNASRHTRQGQIEISAQPLSDADGQRVCVRVSDTGKGMDPAVARNICKPFSRQEGGDALTRVSGAGLGLSICCQIAAAHGGTIRVEPNPCGGTVFVVDLAADLKEPVEVSRQLNTVAPIRMSEHTVA